MSFVFPAALSRKEGKHDHPRYDEKLKVDRWGCFVEHEQCWQKTICVFWSQFQIWKLHLSLVSCNFITALVFFWHHVFNNFPLSSLFSKETSKRACFSLPESRLGLWKMCQLKRTIKRLRIWRHWAPSPSSNKDQGWCPFGLKKERYISMHIYGSVQVFFSTCMPKISPQN